MGDAVAEHIYLSTACLHGEHGYCQADTGQCGAKTPGVCKFCPAPCVCDCHRPQSGRERSPEPVKPYDTRCWRCAREHRVNGDGVFETHSFPGTAEACRGSGQAP